MSVRTKLVSVSTRAPSIHSSSKASLAPDHLRTRVSWCHPPSSSEGVPRRREGRPLTRPPPRARARSVAEEPADAAGAVELEAEGPVLESATRVVVMPVEQEVALEPPALSAVGELVGVRPVDELARRSVRGRTDGQALVRADPELEGELSVTEAVGNRQLMGVLVVVRGVLDEGERAAGRRLGGRDQDQQRERDDEPRGHHR